MNTFITSDNQKVELPKSVIEMSETIKNMFNVLGEINECIPLPNVNKDTLLLIIEFCDKYHNCDIPEMNKFSDWDNNFFNLPNHELFDLVMAANYMEVKPLISMCCMYIASEVKKCTSPEEIKRRFDINKDYTV